MKLSLLISALATIHSAHAFNWRWSSSHATCNGDPFTNVALAVRCTTASGKYTRLDPSHCGLGDTAHAKGSLLATMLFSNGQVQVTPSVAGLDLVWDKKVYGHLSDWLTALDGQQFGEPGRYTISYAMALPSEEGSWPLESWILDNLVTGHITVKNAGDCTKDKEEEQWYPTYRYGFVGVMMCMATGVLVKKANRRCAEGETDDNDDPSPLSYYEMAGGSGEGGVVV